MQPLVLADSTRPVILPSTTTLNDTNLNLQDLDSFSSDDIKKEENEAKQKLKPTVDSTPTDTYGSKFPQGRPRELFETTETQSLSRCVPEPVASLADESKRSNVLNGTDQKPRRALIYGGRVCFRASIMWRSFESF